VPGTEPWARINLFDDAPWQDIAPNGRPGIAPRSWMAVAALALDALVVLVLVTVAVFFVVSLIELGHAFTNFMNGVSHFNLHPPPTGGP
jgi:hypothetical protein